MAASYFLSSMASLNEQIGLIAQFLPHDYFQGGDALNGLKIDWLLGLVGVSAAMTGLAWLLFLRRDIRLGGEGIWHGKKSAAG